MKSTRLNISVSQDGLLPQETAEIATLEFPTLPKKLLKALGFERVDSKTYVGVLPVFINLGDKDQEIEIELGVTLPEMRKKIIDIVKTPARLISVARENTAARSSSAGKSSAKKTAASDSKEKPKIAARSRKTSAAKKSAGTAKKSSTASKTSTAKKAPSTKKTASKKKTTSKKTSGRSSGSRKKSS